VDRFWSKESWLRFLICCLVQVRLQLFRCFTQERPIYGRGLLESAVMDEIAGFDSSSNRFARSSNSFITSPCHPR
jgi:hypothetical protein